MTPRYEYEPLPDKDHLRLLRLSLDPGSPHSLEVFSVDDCPAYNALSYTWGSPIDEPELIVEYEEEISLAIKDREEKRNEPIKRNLHEALLRITALPNLATVYIWVDAVCINQKDDEEVANQVKLIGKIYSRCQYVIAWLGEADEHFKGAHSIFCESLGPRLVDAVRTRKWPGFPVSDNSLSDMAERLGLSIPFSHWQSFVGYHQTRRYFLRAWVVQELALASDILVLCGDALIPWENVYQVHAFMQNYQGIDFMYIAKQLSGRLVHLEFTDIASLRKNCRRGGPKEQKDEYGNVPIHHRLIKPTTERENIFTFLAMLLNVGQLKDCSRPHDKVYSLLGIMQKFSGDLVDVTVDYSQPCSKLFTEVAWLLIQELPELYILATVQDHSVRSLRGLPSWVPDWTVRRETVTINNLKLNTIDASCVRSNRRAFRNLTGTALHLEGVALERISSIIDSFTDSDNALEQPRIAAKKLSWLRSILTAVLEYKLVCKEGETAYDVVSKTLTAQLRTDSGEISPSLFGSWIICFVTVEVGFFEELQPFVDIFSELLNTLRRDISPNFPGSEKLTRTVRINRREVPITQEFENLFGAFMDFNSVMRRVVCNRAVYVTENGRLGIGPLSTRPGDSVWLIDGARELHVLRDTDLPSENEFTLIGETYLYGLMNGEALQTEAKERIDLFSLV